MNKTFEEAQSGRHEFTSSSLTPLRPVANLCTAGNCPTVYVSGTGTLVVQGYAVPAERAGIDVPEGELLVEIPLDLLTEAVRNLS
ncbi:hypothetical protein [Paractinoplanes durhamensis]|uniref:Uncharacterized protein n=1 Tax=Paractinoplanes durhamensis TaxID=113563 RepID=A0ABQ3ZB25_9ACTN|nr:hypothetical protein [Actinoplanes durhamensis]GIE07028.1 hypothetical protein Adu01nite_83780 [Actinoplanes durhamensis]